MEILFSCPKKQIGGNTMNKLFAKVLNIRKAIADSPFTRKALSSVLALTVVLTPLSPAIAVSADEIAQDNEAVEEMTVETEATVQETEVAVPVETTVVPDYSEYATEETTVVVEDEDLVTSDPTEEIDTTAPPTEQKTDVAESATTEETTVETRKCYNTFNKTILNKILSGRFINIIPSTAVSNNSYRFSILSQRVTNKTIKDPIRGCRNRKIRDLEYTKNEKANPRGGRLIPITEKCRSALKIATELPGESEYVFHHPNGKPIVKDSYEYYLRRRCKTLGIPISHNHAFRVAFNAKLIEAGVDGNERCLVLGHSMQTNERHYSFSDRRKVDNVRAKLNNLMLA